MAEPKIRLLIADDHPVVHRGLDGLLFADPRIEVVATVTRFAGLLDQLTVLPVDVVLLDLSGMGVSPLMMVRELRARFPQTGVLIFSSSLALAPELLGAGALGYVVKEEVLDHLPAAIVAVATGQTYHSPLVQEALDRAAAMHRELPMAPQERVVMKLVANAWTTTQIAAELEIDPRSAQNYITTLLRKTGCESRQQLAAWYRRHYEGHDD
jgi:DNA-binding NarL/FixJ family response regulator